MRTWLREKLQGVLHRIEAATPVPKRDPCDELAHLRSQLAAIVEDRKTLAAMLERHPDSFHRSIASGTTAHADSIDERADQLKTRITALETRLDGSLGDTVMSQPDVKRAHLIIGGFPLGALAGHDMDYVRHRILALLQEFPSVRTSVASDYQDIERWLPGTDLLITYTAGPFANDEQADTIEQWMAGRGRWLALHGSSGGKAIKITTPDGPRKKMVKARHHDAIGGFFLNHPPIRRFTVKVEDAQHPITQGLPAQFDVADELYMVEVQDPSTTHVLLTTALDHDPSPPGFGFVYDADTSLLSDGHTRVLGYERTHGEGGVTYIALGHCHHPQSNTQPRVDESISSGGTVPNPFRGSWEDDALPALIRNGIRWGVRAT